MESLAKANLLAGVGLEGDRYAQKVGTYSVFRSSKLNAGEQEPGRQLTLISADGAEAVLSKAGISIDDLGSLRRNIVLRGVPEGELLKWVGKTVRIGSTAVVFCHRHCVPCMYNERKNGIVGLVEAVWDEAGVSCEILIGGEVCVGDDVVVMSKEELIELNPDLASKNVDEGVQGGGFFIRPSQRSAEMVHENLQKKRDLHIELGEVDPEGVARLESSYHSQGLKFFPEPISDGPPVVAPPPGVPAPGSAPCGNEPGDTGRETLKSKDRGTRRNSDSGLYLFHFSDSSFESTDSES